MSHIVTFGSMAAKMAIKDVARVLKLELSEANRLAKMVPEAPKMTLKKAYKENPDLEKEKQSLNPLISKTIQFAETLEGSIRQTRVLPVVSSSAGIRSPIISRSCLPKEKV